MELLKSRLISVFDLHPIVLDNGPEFSFRIEIHSDLKTGRYFSRVFRLETFRIQPTFPQDDGVPALEASDEPVWVRDDVLLPDDPCWISESDCLDHVVSTIRARFTPVEPADKTAANFPAQIDGYRIELDTEADTGEKAKIASLIASSYLALQQHDEAEKYYEMARSLDPLDRDLAASYAWYCLTFAEDYTRCLSVIGELDTDSSASGTDYGLHRLLTIKGASELIIGQLAAGFQSLETAYSAGFASKLREPDISSLVTVKRKQPNLATGEKWRHLVGLLQQFSRINMEQYGEISDGY